MVVCMKYEAKTESAFERIRLAILAGELAPGMPLRMSQLSKHYEISATPLREALSRLEEKRLVVAEPNKVGAWPPFHLKSWKIWNLLD